MTMVLAICPAGTANCTAATAAKSFTETMSTKSCPVYQRMFQQFPEYAPNYVRNRYSYTSAPGSVFAVTCTPKVSQ
jgi:hypothetical protein